MSRSYKKHPFQAICGNSSARWDKQQAHKGERRATKQAVRKAVLEGSLDDFLVPHRLECHHNDVWGWNRDGNQNYCGLTGKDWARYIQATSGEDDWPARSRYYDQHYSTWPPEWYKQMLRK